MIFFPDVDGGLTIFDTSPQEGCQTELNAHVSPNYGTSVPVGTISEGIQNLFLRIGSSFCRSTKTSEGSC